MKILKSGLYYFLFYFVFLFFLLTFLHHSEEESFDSFFLSLENQSPRSRYGNLFNKIILHDQTCGTARGLTQDWLPSKDIDSAAQLIAEGEADAYLASVGEIEEFVKQNRNWKITGINTYGKNYAFLVTASSKYKVSNRRMDQLSLYLRLLKNYFSGNFGYNRYRTRLIADSVSQALPYTIMIMLLSIITIIVVSLLFSYILTFSRSLFLRKFLEKALSLFSFVPEFLLGFGLLYLFHFNRIPFLQNLKFYDDSANYFIIGKISFDLQLLKYFSLPVIALCLANGTVSIITKLLHDKMENIKKSNKFKFFSANGMKNFFLRYFIILKNLLPIIGDYLALRIPIIIGSSFIIERIFDIQGLGNLAYREFRMHDCGIILIIFSIIYFITIFLNIFFKSLNNYLQPILKKQSL